MRGMLTYPTQGCQIQFKWGEDPIFQWPLHVSPPPTPWQIPACTEPSRLRISVVYTWNCTTIAIPSQVSQYQKCAVGLSFRILQCQTLAITVSLICVHTCLYTASVD